jgi:hypothetical protein
MTMPIKAIDRLFQRLTLTYGRSFLLQWEGLPENDVKSLWAHELEPYSNRLEAIAWALEHLPDRAPNAIEFKNLCRSAPAPAAQQLPEPKADPERVKRELARLGEVRAQAAHSRAGIDHKAWAKRIMARHDAGEKINPTSLQFAREALRVHLPTLA